MTGRRLLRLALPVLLFLAGGGFAAAQTSDLFAGFQSDSKDPVQVDAATLEVFEEGKQRISVFSGGVTVKRGKTTLKASTIKLFSDLEAKGGGGSDDAFTKIEASGTVYVNSGQQTVTGDRALVDMKTQIITLLGDVVLSQGKSVMTGTKLTVNLKTGSAKLESDKRIQGVLTPDAVRGATPKGTPEPKAAPKPKKP